MSRVTWKQQGLWEDVDSANMMSSSWQCEIYQPVMNMGTCKDVMIQILWHAGSSEIDQEPTGSIKIKELSGEGYNIYIYVVYFWQFCIPFIISMYV